MHGIKVEHRCLSEEPLSQDLARDLYKRLPYGKAVVVTDRPIGMLSPFKKQWVRIIRKVQIERARTLNAARILELTEQIERMRSLKFVAKAPEDCLAADVTFATVNDFITYAPDCATMYVTCKIPREKLHAITSWMPQNGLVIIYE